MTLEFDVAVKALDEHIEILKQELLFAMAVAEENKSESAAGVQEIITIKRELDKAVQERMKLSRIYSNYDSSNSGSATATAASVSAVASA